MKTTPVSELKKHCTRLLREVAKERTTLLITNRSRPIAKVIPLSDPDQHPALGAMRGHLRQLAADFDEPLGDVEWESAQ